MTEKEKLLDILDELDEKAHRDLVAVLYALAIIRRETGHGTLVIVVKDGEISEMSAEHKIRPKYLNP